MALILVEAINTLRKAMVLPELAATTVAIFSRGDPASYKRGLSAGTPPIAARTISVARQVSSRARSTFALCSNLRRYELNRPAPNFCRGVMRVMAWGAALRRAIFDGARPPRELCGR